jgi:hypothetical protein
MNQPWLWDEVNKWKSSTTLDVRGPWKRISNENMSVDEGLEQRLPLVLMNNIVFGILCGVNSFSVFDCVLSASAAPQPLTGKIVSWTAPSRSGHKPWPLKAGMFLRENFSITR